VPAPPDSGQPKDRNPTDAGEAVVVVGLLEKLDEETDERLVAT